MKVRMYRNYDKFPYESDHHGNFNGRMIFTFFRPISGAFDCILVELPENTPGEIIDMIEKESTRRDVLISSHGEEDWG